MDASAGQAQLLESVLACLERDNSTKSNAPHRVLLLPGVSPAGLGGLQSDPGVHPSILLSGHNNAEDRAYSPRRYGCCVLLKMALLGRGGGSMIIQGC